MHPSAFENGKQFVSKYLHLKESISILDVGAYDICGSLKSLLQKPNWIYTGMDRVAGRGVDVVLGDAQQFPFEDSQFDVEVATSCFEHDPVFWMTFGEMVRTTKHNGLIYACTPSRGPYHGFPGDCWRFQKDSYEALAKWCPEAKLVEQYIDDSKESASQNLSEGHADWRDNVGIFRVDKTSARSVTRKEGLKTFGKSSVEV
jgi:SAM-dependent methyltransferase